MASDTYFNERLSGLAWGCVMGAVAWVVLIGVAVVVWCLAGR